LLRLLADSTGGEVIPLTAIDTIGEKLAARREKRALVKERPLWDSGYLFAFVVACFGTEWALRKRFGLA
jgi:hypothetical protein